MPRTAHSVAHHLLAPTAAGLPAAACVPAAGLRGGRLRASLARVSRRVPTLASSPHSLARDGGRDVCCVCPRLSRALLTRAPLPCRQAFGLLTNLGKSKKRYDQL